MVIDSKYTKTFKSNELTRQKYDELYAFAVMLCDHKNFVSEYVNSNLEKYLENRVNVTVLRDSLLKQLDNGAYEPRKLKREKVKYVLLSFRRSLMNKPDGERCESGMTTFDYV